MSERDALAAPRQPHDVPYASRLCIVGIGASAGGLEACRRFLTALPASSGMAFILIQHLDPNHDSMMAALLGNGTAMKVVEAEDGMEVEADHLYIIPPGLYLSLTQGRLNLTEPSAPHGARLPFDFLLQSLAAAAGNRAACVILSGGGADGSIGVRAIKAAGGLVIAQAPAEAGEAGMPNSAIATGAVDYILPATEIASALLRFGAAAGRRTEAPDIAGIIALLKLLTAHDFTLYKSGTLERRIGRRMTLAGFGHDETGRYMERVKNDQDERDQLVNDLLINVTNFFRDPKIFELLAATVIPEVVKQAEGSIRLWVAGCSTGEETYSLAMLLLECIEAEKSNVRLQIFATDVDAEAIMRAREGVYTNTIEKDVSAARLAKFFIREEDHYRVSPALRGCIIFAVQDVLADPPFSKLNMVSCRNLLIYLRPQAQEHIISVFNFALSPGGYLLLGAAETIAAPDRRFKQVSKPARLYRKIGTSEPEHLPAVSRPDFLRLLPAATPQKSKLPDLGEIGRKLLLERYSPPAIMVNARLECLYTFGAPDMFLRGPSGPASHDMLAQLPSAMRGRMRDAITEAAASDSPIRVDGGRVKRDGITRLFHVELQALPGDKDKFLVCFIAEAGKRKPLPAIATARGNGGVAELEAELSATRSELELAVQYLETASKEHNAINDEALSVNEEYQSTNEELLTSKEELQSLNEELTALNSQLQETLERSRMTSADLRNVLYSTDVPTLFLDLSLNIRFFTPSTTSLFHLMPTDIGRKLADFRSRAIDPDLLADAATVLATTSPAICEIQTEAGLWYQRHIQPYRTFDGATGGVVITFTDINERKLAAAALEASRLEAERANIAKSRFLAAASHDLRQPLQTMALINGLLGKTVTGAEPRALIARLDHTMQSISTMLNAMLDINQIEAGIVKAEIAEVDVNDLFTRMGAKFEDQAAAQNTSFRVMPCSHNVASDPALLEQMLTNLLGNALKYTKTGRVLLGARRHGDMLRIEVWDTGIGIAADQLKTIFDEYHQINNKERAREFGLGLGLSIVQRLANLLGHTINVESTPFKGSVFSIDVPVVHITSKPAVTAQPAIVSVTPGTQILVIEDDPDIRQLLAGFLTEEGYMVTAADDGPTAKALVTSGAVTPALVIADYNLPGQETGLRVAYDLRVFLRRQIPVIICTGDISTATLRLIADADCVQMNKPMKLDTLMAKIQDQLRLSAAASTAAASQAVTPDDAKNIIYVVDDDPAIREAMRTTFEQAGMKIAAFPDSESFLAALPSGLDGSCLLVDSALPGISGVQLLQKLNADHIRLPAIMITGRGDIGVAVQAMKAGAADFMEKPVNPEELLACVSQVLAQSRDHHAMSDSQRQAARHIAELTIRQREVLDRVLAGQPSKNIPADLGISQRTVENHRAAIMLKTGAKSIPALARLAIAATSSDTMT